MTQDKKNIGITIINAIIAFFTALIGGGVL
jgi:hypothetical protein